MRMSHFAAFPILAVAASLPAQATTPAVQWLPKAEIEQRRAQTAGPWVSLFATTTLQMGRYTLAKDGVDEQTPHARDEVYVVLAGKAKLEAGGASRAMVAGDAVFVPARVPHRFVEIEEDLDILVFFSAARAPSGGMAAGAPPTEQTPFPENSQRGNTRIFYWFGPDSAGQLAIDYGRPRWQPAFGKFVQKAGGPRWRFGENFWTTLDTNIPLQLGGVDVAPGLYYLALQHPAANGVQLVLLDPDEVRARRLDAYEVPKTTGGIVVTMKAATSDLVADELEVELTVDTKTKDTGALTIRFGPHVLTAPLVMRPHRG